METKYKLSCDLAVAFKQKYGLLYSISYDLNDVLTISEQEMSYWKKRGLEPFYIYEKAEEGWENQITGLPNLQTI